MKTGNSKGNKVLPAVISLIVLSSVALGQDDGLLRDTESVLDSQQIDIDGQFNRKSEADRIAEMRRKLEKKNEDMALKKIEDMRIQEEKKLTEKLRGALEGKLQAMDEEPVQMQQAAPAPVVPVVTAPIEAPKKGIEGEVKIIPLFGMTSVQGENSDWESKMSAGLSIESMLAERFSMGVRFNYATMELQDTSSIYSGPTYYQYTYAPGYFNNYNSGRQIDYNKWMVGVSGKFFLSYHSRFKPYVGMAVDYNRSKLEYKDRNWEYPNNFSNVYYGDEGYSSSYVSGSLMVGSEIRFTDNVGLALEFAYSRGLSSSYGNKSTSRSGYYNADQLKLEGIGADIEEANVFNLGAGFVIAF